MNENVFNGEPSSVLGCFDIVGQPFDRVNNYSEIPTQRKISPRNYNSSMRIFVTDENKEIINFNGLTFFELQTIKWLKMYSENIFRSYSGQGCFMTQALRAEALRN